MMCDSIMKSFVILIFFIDYNSLVLVFLFVIANAILFNEILFPWFLQC